jgi:hypothetical protein
MGPKEFPAATLLAVTTGCCFGGATRTTVNELYEFLMSVDTNIRIGECRDNLLKSFPELSEAEMTGNFNKLMQLVYDADGGENAETTFNEWLDWMIAKGSKIQRTYMVSPIAV